MKRVGSSLSHEGADYSWRHLAGVLRMERLEMCVKK